MVEELGEVGTEIGKQAARNNHLLLKEQRCVEEQVEFLNAEEVVALIDQKGCCHSNERQQWHTNRPARQSTTSYRK